MPAPCRLMRRGRMQWGDMMTKEAEILKLAQSLIDRPSRWLQGVLAVDAKGNKCEPNDENACAWCAVGALSHGLAHLCRSSCAIRQADHSYPVTVIRRGDDGAAGMMFLNAKGSRPFSKCPSSNPPQGAGRNAPERP